MATRYIYSPGTLGFGLARETEVMCGVRKADNSFERMAYTFGAKDIGWEKEVSESFRAFVSVVASDSGLTVGL